MQYLKACIFSLFTFVSVYCSGQTVYSPVYTRRDGIPSLRIYQTLQDKQGFLWLCTDNGICRFNGNTFTTFGPEDGFVDNGAFHMFHDSQNRLWFITFTGRIWYFQYGKFHQLPFKHPQSNDIKWIDEDKSGNIYLSTSRGGMFKIHKDFSYEFLQTKLQIIISFVVLSDSTIFMLGPIEFKLLLNFKIITDFQYASMWRNYSTYVILKDGSLIVSTEKGLIRYHNNMFSPVLPAEDYKQSVIISFTYDSLRDNIWACTLKGIFQMKLVEGKLHVVNHLLRTQSVTSCVTDNNGNLWLSGFNLGLVYLQPNKSKWYMAPPGDIASNNFDFIIPTGKGLYFINSVGELYKLKNGKLIQECTITRDKSELFFNSLVGLANGQILVFVDHKSLLIENGKVKNNPKIDFTEGASSRFDRTVDGETVALHSTKYPFEEIALVKNATITGKFPVNRHFPLQKLSVIKSFSYQNENTQWIGTKDGLYRIQFRNDSTYIEQPFKTKCYVAHLCSGPDSVLWVSTTTLGLLALKSGKLVKKFSVFNGLLSDNVRKAIIDEQNNVWVVTLNGLNKIITPFSRHPEVISYNQYNLLPSNEIFDVYIDKKTAYVATGNGIVSFETSTTPYTPVTMPVFYTKIKIGEKLVSINKVPEAFYGNPISFYYDIPWFGIGEKPQYKYIITGFEDTWHQTQENVLTFNSLPPGTYTLEVTAVNPKITRTIPAFTTFKILPSYWQTLWFKTIMLLILGATLGFILYKVFKSRQKSMEISRQYVISQLNALRAQINPHFIFNSLNSIQEFILDHQPRLANTYLSQFASLMRMIIENSKRDFISLQEEIEFLQLYISLEKLRLNNELSFDIKTDESIDIFNMQLPPMILQPIVENAIKHGLSSQKHSRILSVDFALNNQGITCVVTDNGIGRSASANHGSIRKNSGSSIGLSATIQRLQLIYGEKKSGLHITDLTDSDGNSSGTRVEIFIPIT